MPALADPQSLAKTILRECLEQLDSLEVPDPLPYSLVLSNPAHRKKIASIGTQRYVNADPAPSTEILGAKGEFSFRRFSRVSPASLIAYELFAREFAVQSDENWSKICASFRFDPALPKRLYPERKPSDRNRWVKFKDERDKLLAKCGEQTTGVSHHCMAADLSRFFDLVRHDRLCEEMSHWYPLQGSRIEKAIEFLGKLTGDNEGLPTGPQCSFFFADLLLLRADEVAAKRVKNVIRWVDELWWFDKYPSKLEGSFRDTLLEYTKLGLNFNDKKCGFVKPGAILAETKSFDRFREMYYNKLPQTSAAKVAFLCGFLIDRVDQEAMFSYSDKFIINRIRELFREDPKGAMAASAITIEAFRRSYDRSRDSLNIWHAVLKCLPDRAAVVSAAYDCFKAFRYPMDSDRARLLELITSFDSKPQFEGIIKTDELAKGAQNRKKCVTYRGNALRAFVCRTQDHQLARTLAKKESDREFRQYIAAAALCLPRPKCCEIIATLRDAPVDDEDAVLMSAYADLCPAKGTKPEESPNLFLLPMNATVIAEDLARSVRNAY